MTEVLRGEVLADGGLQATASHGMNLTERATDKGRVDASTPQALLGVEVGNVLEVGLKTGKKKKKKKKKKVRERNMSVLQR